MNIKFHLTELDDHKF